MKNFVKNLFFEDSKKKICDLKKKLKNFLKNKNFFFFKLTTKNFEVFYKIFEMVRIQKENKFFYFGELIYKEKKKKILFLKLKNLKKN